MSRSWNDRVLVAVLLARFVRARWGYRFRSRERFDAWHGRRLARFLRRLRAVPYYASDVRPAGVDGSEASRTARVELSDLPIVDKGVLLEHFDGLNTRGVRLVDALGVALEAERTRDFAPLVAGDLTVGLSSGTSGRRGAFLVSPRERMLWAGTVLARVLDRRSVGQLLRPWAPPVRIAFFLRAGGNLYESVASSRIRFSFHDLTEPFDSHLAALDAGAAAGAGPHVLVAPASVLAALADRAREGRLRIRPRLVISVAEVLEPEVAERIRRAWGRAPRQVYQATEGLLALTCEHGSLHLNEESVRVEREWLDAERTRFTPIVTDFDRRTQIIARYRLDDVLRVDPAAPRCPCGRVTTVLAGVDGRADAVLRLPHASGLREVELFPDVVRQAMAVASEAYADWRIRQRGLDLHVSLAEPAPGAEVRVRELLERLLRSHGGRVDVVFDAWEPADPTVKARRIVREPASA
ncbi:F390 synthetase-related protein [Herbiconiux sp.]|uniref:F390 synthetase-related protein n=1 Tax=Herbiconiux sp. TaxID=1871186 RepID=UPI0025C2F2D7|nr:F390 synthetase-related protein [Herbiconiux sp.]